MVSLILAIVNSNFTWQIIGYILTALEVIFVIAKILLCFIPADTKFGKILKVIVSGVPKAKEVLHDNDSEETKDSK